MTDLNLTSKQKVETIAKTIERHRLRHHHESKVFLNDMQLEKLLKTIERLYPARDFEYHAKAVLLVWQHFFQDQKTPIVDSEPLVRKILGVVDPRSVRSFFNTLNHQRRDPFAIQRADTVHDKVGFENTFREMLDQHLDLQIKHRHSRARNDIPRPPIPQYVRDFMKSFRQTTRERVLTVDSRDRNHSDYPDANDYQIQLELPLEYIFQMELVSADIPKSEYVVHSDNNLLHFRELNSQVSAGTFYTATLTEGNYTIAGLLTEIVTQLNVAGAAFYTIALTSDNHIKLTSDGTGGDGLFHLHFFGGNEQIGGNGSRAVYFTGSIGKVLGFRPVNFTGSALTYTATNLYNLDTETIVFLHIENLNNTNYQRNRRFSAFLKIPLDVEPGQVKFYRSRDDARSVLKIRPVLRRMQRLQISFRRSDRSLYRFHGKPHSLTFRFLSLFASPDVKMA